MDAYEDLAKINTMGTVKEPAKAPAICFQAKLFRPDATDRIGSGTLLALPKSASAKLPSRGMTMVEGTINGYRFQAALEPDGKGSHWFQVNKTLRQAAGVDAGDTATLVIEPTKKWPEPRLPAGLKTALAANPPAHAAWMDITPMARWDWIRWISSAKQLETRQRRIANACSMLGAGKRRPCCFDRSQCTLTEA